MVQELYVATVVPNVYHLTSFAPRLGTLNSFAPRKSGVELSVLVNSYVIAVSMLVNVSRKNRATRGFYARILMPAVPTIIGQAIRGFSPKAKVVHVVALRAELHTVGGHIVLGHLINFII